MGGDAKESDTTMRKRGYTLGIKAVIGAMALVLLGGCSSVVLEPKGPIAADERYLLIVATLLMLIVVLPVFALIAIFAWRYRASNKKAKYTPEWAHSTLLEVVWWTVPCIIIGVLAVITWISTHELDPYKPLNKGKPLTIQVVALDWKWLFIYPEQNIATVNYVKLPVDTPIRFEVTADAPMNSFYIPALGGQIYAMEGMKTQLHLIADDKGNYHGRSINISGEGFSEMTFTASATGRKAFETWVDSVKSSSKVLTAPRYQKLAEPSIDNQPEYFSAVEPPDLFRRIIYKFMSPNMNAVDDSTKGEVRL